MSDKMTIPYWKKYTLSIEEAAAYFRIGEIIYFGMETEFRLKEYCLKNT